MAVDRVKLGRANRRKGAAYERKVANIMTKLTGQTYRRTPYSGAGHIPGDIMRLPEPFPYEIELKNRHDITLTRIFKNPNTIQKYVSDTQILIFNESSLSMVVIHKDMYINLVRKQETIPFPLNIDTNLSIGGDRYWMITLKDFCNLIKEEDE